MADQTKLQDAELLRMEKRNKNGGSYNDTIKNIMSSELIAKRKERRLKTEQELRDSNIYVGGYPERVVNEINAKRENGQPRPEESGQVSHSLLLNVVDSFPVSEISKSDAKAFKNWSLVLLDNGQQKLTLTITRISTVSMICELTNEYQKKYHRFNTETDHSIVLDVKTVTETTKYSAKLSEPRRTMLRIVDSIICKYRIKDETKHIDNGGWSNLLDN
jgi:hypothetical protein